MTLHTILSSKRKELGLTQEQIANCLGVSTPAVNKWEKGATYPDITLLPALARVLDTDLNTLLGFNQNLSEAEIALFMNQTHKTFQEKGLPTAFSNVIEKTHEYPTDGKFLYSVATHLEGLLMMTELTPDEKDSYEAQIDTLYERVTTCDDSKYANIARYMLASKCIASKNLSHAQELLDELPEPSSIDKRILQAKYYQQEENYDEAGKLYERLVFTYIQSMQAPLINLIQIAVKEGNLKNATLLAKCGQEVSTMLGQWQYTSLLYPLELAIAAKDVQSSLSAIRSTLEALFTPWDMSNSPIYSHQDTQSNEISLQVQAMLPSLLLELETKPEYDFLRNEIAFNELLQEYHAKC